MEEQKPEENSEKHEHGGCGGSAKGSSGSPSPCGNSASGSSSCDGAGGCHGDKPSTAKSDSEECSTKGNSTEQVATGCGSQGGCGGSSTAESSDSNGGDKCSRSQFLRAAVPCVGGVWALMAAYPIYSYLTPNGGDEPESKVSSVTVGDIKDLPPGSGKNFKFGSMPALITHTKDGEFHAFSAVCTHLGCTVQFRPEKDLIWCACHGGCYDPSSGKNVAGPPPKPLLALKVEVVKDKIIVSKV
jgi:Rieske Fe-S protein